MSLLPSPLQPDDLLIEQLGREIATSVFNMPLKTLPEWCAIQPEDTMIMVVEWLKAKAQQAWGRPLEESEALAKTIIEIGQCLGSRSIEALGTMALGDGQKIRGDRQELARENLNRAGELYLEAGSRVGWGRTRIGLLHLALDLNFKDAALADAYDAARIFKDEGTPLFLLRLNNAMGQLFDRIGESDKALLHYQEALDLALEIKAESELGNLYNNLGVCELELGNLKAAFNHFENARERFLKQDQPVYAAIARHNMGIIHMFRGNYRKSIQEMQAALNVVDGASHYFQSVKSRCDLAVAYLELNRYEEAEKVLEQGRQWFESAQSPYYAGRILLYLALVQAYLHRFDDAHAALDQAETLLNLVLVEKRLLELDTMRARVALLQGDYDRAHAAAMRATSGFRLQGRMLDYTRAMLLLGHALFQKSEYDAVLTTSQEVLEIAPELHLLQENYDAHLLVAQTLEKQRAFDQARVEYAVAARQLNQVYHSLTVALRANYLATKQDGLRGWIRVAVLQGEIEEALNALEQSRGQLWLRYLREDRWIETPQTESLLRHLEWLRSKYRWLSEQEKDRTTLLACENEIHAVIEQLQNYIHGSDIEAPLPSVADLRSVLDSHPYDDALLIAYYDDGERLWAFVLDQTTFACVPLPVTCHDLRQTLDLMARNFNSTVYELEQQTDPYIQTPSLTVLAQKLGNQLYDRLIQPLWTQVKQHRHLVIVPFGELHYLPFNTLYRKADNTDGVGDLEDNRYLIEYHDITLIPAISLLTISPPRRPEGALVLAHSASGRREIAQTRREADMVARLLGGEVLPEAKMLLEALNTPPRQVLHIASHGKYRLNRPGASLIQFADGPLFADYLFQYDLSYELITLSACETLRAKVTPGDDLIGLGRGFLYAGSGALVASLWSVHDVTTCDLMQYFYEGLTRGKTKSAALSDAQRDLLKLHPDLHPALWGAFQLVGCPAPLSTDRPVSL